MENFISLCNPFGVELHRYYPVTGNINNVADGVLVRNLPVGLKDAKAVRMAILANFSGTNARGVKP